jgi:hypothetical protein
VGVYDEVARKEKDRQEKGKGRSDIKNFVVYGEEKRCPQCWSLLNEREAQDGSVSKYCSNCAFAVANMK